jgi:hypothetical protein
MDTRADFITRKEFSILKKRYGLLEAHLDKWDIIGEFIANGIRNTRDVERLTIRAMFDLDKIKRERLIFVMKLKDGIVLVLEQIDQNVINIMI